MCVKNEMFNTVNELLEKYIGGQIFFTELDKAVKFNPEILRELHRTAHRKMSPFKPLTIASGEIGLAMHNLDVPVDILVPGGLRFEPQKINLAPFQEKIKGRNILFLDDSYFSGKTATVIKEEIEKLGGKWLGAYVAYDGAKVRDENVWALYRYYDYHDILGRPLKGAQ